MDADVNIPTLARQSCWQDKLLLLRHCWSDVTVLLRSGLIGSGSASSTLARALPNFWTLVELEVFELCGEQCSLGVNTVDLMLDLNGCLV